MHVGCAGLTGAPFPKRSAGDEDSKGPNRRRDVWRAADVRFPSIRLRVRSTIPKFEGYSRRRETHVATEAPPGHVITLPKKASDTDTGPPELTRSSRVPVARANPALAALAENAITALESLVATRKRHLSILSSQCNSAMNQYLSAVELQLFMAPKQVTLFLVIDTDPALKKGPLRSHE